MRSAWALPSIWPGWSIWSPVTSKSLGMSLVSIRGSLCAGDPSPARAIQSPGTSSGQEWPFWWHQQVSVLRESHGVLVNCFLPFVYVESQGRWMITRLHVERTQLWRGHIWGSSRLHPEHYAALDWFPRQISVSLSVKWGALPPLGTATYNYGSAWSIMKMKPGEYVDCGLMSWGS